MTHQIRKKYGLLSALNAEESYSRLIKKTSCVYAKIFSDNFYDSAESLRPLIHGDFISTD